MTGEDAALLTEVFSCSVHLVRSPSNDALGQISQLPGQARIWGLIQREAH
jgi:hypothetical protein